MKNIITHIVSIFIIFSFSSHANDISPDMITKAMMESCIKRNISEELCLCELNIWNKKLTDKQRGFLLVGLELENSNSNLSTDEIMDIMTKSYDSDGEIQKKVLELKPIVDSEVKDKCKI